MPDIWVVNASPVITLAKAGHLRLLTDLAGEVLLPEAAAAEIVAGPAADPARLAVEGGWGKRVAPAAIPSQLLSWGLGAGETAVLAVALERLPCHAVLDDAVARQCARKLGVPVLGTLGVVLRARKGGLIPSAADVVVALRAAGLHLDDRAIESALQHVGESWPPAGSVP